MIAAVIAIISSKPRYHEGAERSRGAKCLSGGAVAVVVVTDVLFGRRVFPSVQSVRPL
jgi:hypothetical protein